MLQKLRVGKNYGLIYKAKDISCCAIFINPDINNYSNLKYIYYLVKENKDTELQLALIPSQYLIRNIIVMYSFKLNIKISDVYYTIRVYSPYVKYAIFSTLHGSCRTRVM